MKNWILLIAIIPASFSCKKKRQDDMAFKFCDKVTSSKSEYLKCFTDIVECYDRSSDQFDEDMKFIECARLFQVAEPSREPFKYVPTISETDLDAEVWREIENLDAADATRRKPEPKVEPEKPKFEMRDDSIKPAKPKPKPHPVSNLKPKTEKAIERIKQEMEVKDIEYKPKPDPVQPQPTPEPAPNESTITPEKAPDSPKSNFDF